ncbi:MAG: serine--tRNA ligase, partial [Pseudomonadota bacterium]|nr:serine--tRNA ligase [Pseudomonadota bacterium]
MLDIKQVRKDPQAIAEALQKKRYDFPLDEFVRLDSQRKEADVRSQDLLAERKKASKQIGALIAQGKSVDEAKAEVNETLARLSTELDAAVEEAKTVQQALDELLMGTPNLPDA